MRTGRLLFYEGWDLPNGTAWDSVRWTSPGGAGSTINVQSAGGRIAMAGVTGNFGEYGSMYLSGVVTPDYEVVVDATFGNATAEQYVKGHVGDAITTPANASPNNSYGFQIILGATQKIELQKYISGAQTEIGTVAVTIAASTNYRVRFRREGPFIGVRIWDPTTAEPNAWTATTTDWDNRGPAYSLFSLGMVNGTGPASGETATFDNLSIVELVAGRPVKHRATPLTAIPRYIYQPAVQRAATW